MSKQAMREETERLIREAMEKKSLSIKKGNTRIETKCGKCGAVNRVSAAPGESPAEIQMQGMRAAAERAVSGAAVQNTTAFLARMYW